MKTAVVTGCDKLYIKGAVALYNSIRANCDPDTEVFLLAHGNEEDFADIPKGMKCIFNEETVASPAGGEWTYEMPAMYSRVLIPQIFSDYDRVLWLDADTLVLRDLAPLFNIDMEGKPIASCLPSNTATDVNKLAYQFEDPSVYPRGQEVNGISSGVVLFDVKQWNSEGLSEKINDILLSGIKFKFVVQGVMGMAVDGNYKVIGFEWNAYSHWASSLGMENVNIIHYIGGAGQNPWDTNMAHADLWHQYYNRRYE